MGLSIAFGVVLATCATASPSPTWSGDGIHVVDGTWVLAEQPCDPISDELCRAVVTAAEAALGIDPTSVVRSATTALPVLKAVLPDGQVMVWMRSTSGVAAFAVLDLADGSRRVVGIACIGVPNPDGSRYCDPIPLDDYRVGAAPSF